MTIIQIFGVKGCHSRCLFFYRVMKERIPTDDILKRMKINVVSKCYCYEVDRGETGTLISNNSYSSKAMEALWFVCGYQYGGSIFKSNTPHLVEYG